jgi:hypothetical protein
MQEDNDYISRKELDAFAANILINLALINVAALAASLTVLDEKTEFTSTPFIVGLLAAVATKVLWFCISCFDQQFKEAKDGVNKIIGGCISLLIAILGLLSAGCIIAGGLKALGFDAFCSYSLSFAFCSICFFLLFYTFYRENSFRSKSRL